MQDHLSSGRARLAKNVDSWKAAFGGEPIGGNLEIFERSRIVGWAFDHKNPTRRLTIQVHVNGKPVLDLAAKRYRPDLQRAGYGDGRHGFEIPLVCVPGAVPGVHLQVRVVGRERPLLFHGRELLEIHEIPGLALIAADVVNNCNLRCPFCLVDYTRIRNTEVMSDEVFDKAMQLAELASEGSFLLSCLHEPTLHPHFDRLLSTVPQRLTHKFTFTTNLAKPMTNDMFETWANSRIHHINISLDTFDSELFAVLRKFGRFKVFLDNLERLTKVFRQHPSPPKLRYITMAFKCNLNEIPEIVRRTNEHYLSSANEIRYTFNMRHIADEFRRTEYLEKKDWETLSAQLRALPYPCLIATPPAGSESIDVVLPSANYQIKNSSQDWYGGRVEFPIQLRIRVDGALLVVGHEDHWAVNIRDLEDPKEFVLRMLKSAWAPFAEEELRNETLPHES